MNTIKEVTVFAVGDSSKISTWSNVPYFFTETLRARNIVVNRVNIGPGLVGKLLNRTLLRLLRMAMGGSTYDYLRSLTYCRDVRRRIRSAVHRYPSADLNIFLTFSFSSAGLSKQPVLLFGDWTYDHLFRHFLAREPDVLERQAVAREDRTIESADWVFVLFPSVADAMKRRYANPNIFYGGNVVNSLLQADAAEVLSRKRRSTALLFIGSKQYKEGALRLLRAYVVLKPKYPALSVAIVGMKAKDLGSLPEGVQCHGYLDKGVDSERELYYSLLLSARMIVNTTPKWGAFSAMIEAMYFYNPVVVTPYDEFVATFGAEIAFGRFCADDQVETLCGHIEALLDDDGYADRCLTAHDVVKNYTWGAYIDRLLARVSAIPTKAHGEIADVSSS